MECYRPWPDFCHSLSSFNFNTPNYYSVSVCRFPVFEPLLVVNSLCIYWVDSFRPISILRSSFTSEILRRNQKLKEQETRRTPFFSNQDNWLIFLYLALNVCGVQRDPFVLNSFSILVLFIVFGFCVYIVLTWIFL